MKLFKVVRERFEKIPVHISYNDQIVLNLAESSFVNGLFAQKIVDKLNRVLLSDEEFQKTLDSYQSNKANITSFLSGLGDKNAD